MNTKITTIFASLVLAPVLILICTLVAGAFIPVGTFNAAEKRHIELRAQTLQAAGIISSKEPQPIIAGFNTDDINAAGSVRVNNLG